MAYILRDDEQLFIGCFDETSKDQFKFIVTDLSSYFSENLSLEELENRASDQNESIVLEVEKVVKILKKEKPESCTITNTDDTLRIDLKFAVNMRGKIRAVKFFINAAKCSSDIPQTFLIALMKLAIDNGVMVIKMQKALEAKDKEIEEYKRNGAKLIRGN
jgi:XLF-Cernunnos, XRcc4-like factor, NHEJ component